MATREATIPPPSTSAGDWAWPCGANEQARANLVSVLRGQGQGW